jgi:N-dimethylarginine dimethylaminohydrolase
MVLDEKLCLIHRGTFEFFPCRLYEAGKSSPRHVMFTEFLDQRGFQFIPLTDEECIAGHLNVVVTRRGKKAIGFAEATRIVSEMESLGWEVVGVPGEELFLGNGGPHCMTCPVLEG